MWVGEVTSPSDGITIKPTTSQSQLYTMTQLGFGVYNTSASTPVESYTSVLNSDQSLYGSFANQTYITMDFRGVGLPTASYVSFVNLINIASKG